MELHFLLFKNTKLTYGGNKSKSDLYLFVLVFLFLYIYICICICIFVSLFSPQPCTQGFLPFWYRKAVKSDIRKARNSGYEVVVFNPSNISPAKNPFDKYKTMDLFSGFYALDRSGKSDKFFFWDFVFFNNNNNSSNNNSSNNHNDNNNNNNNNNNNKRAYPNPCSGQRALALIGWFERAVILSGGTKLPTATVTLFIVQIQVAGLAYWLP